MTQTPETKSCREIDREIRLYRRQIARGKFMLEQLEELQDVGTRLQTSLMQELEAEKEKSERLLLSILPRSVVDRLNEGETKIADRYDSVSVLFSDFVGFTKLSSALSAPELVETLSLFFSGFDRLAAGRGIEKIKTIGDAYMAVSGLAGNGENHAEVLIDFAVAMNELVKEVSKKLDQDWSMRVGIHSGPVTAGVIGVDKFAYDVWGDTVNVASRMESNGRACTVHISAETAKLVEGLYCLEPRGLIEIKGKGKMESFFVGKKLLRGSGYPT